ncbi:MAG TPA: hypothetical protein VF855_07090 [Acidimicrobiales bacterium]
MSDHLTQSEAHERWIEAKGWFDEGRFDEAFDAMYGLYGSYEGGLPDPRAVLALDLGICARRLARFAEAESYLQEAMDAPDTTSDVRERAASELRQVRMENSGAEHYSLDDDEGHLTVDQAHAMWLEAREAFRAGNFEDSYASMYLLYGSYEGGLPEPRAALALDLGMVLRRMGRFEEAASFLNEALGGPDTNAEVNETAAAELRQVRLENSGAEHYSLDDDEGHLTVDQAHAMWLEARDAFRAGNLDDAFASMYFLYGTYEGSLPEPRAALALDLGMVARRMADFAQATTFLTEAMGLPDATDEVKGVAAAELRQVRLENSGSDHYNLDDEPH